MTKKYRVAVIGLGGIAKACHLPSLKSISDSVEVVCTCDIKSERCDEADKILGYASKHFTDYKELLKEKLDAVHLCVPNYLHSEIAVAALEKGINVFTEKPDAVSIAEVERMYAAYKKSGKVLMTMRNNRHNPAAKFAVDYLKDKGNTFYAGRCGWIRRRGIPGKGGWFTTKSQSGGGPLIDLGVHMIDLAVYLMGNPVPVSVSGCTYNKFASAEGTSDSVHAAFGDKVENGVFDVEDLAMGFIRFDNGACLQVECSWASNIEKETNFVELRGDKAGLSINDCKLKIYSAAAGQLFDLAPIDGESDGHKANIIHFYDVLEGAKPDFEPMQGVNMIKILSAFYRSAKEGKEIIL